MAKRFAVLGSPVDHSLSPIIHGAAYDLLNLDWSYDRIDVPVSEFSKFFSSESKRFDGFSVTMPDKEAALQVSTSQDLNSSITKSANTLVRVNDSWHAYNTDIFGIQQTLKLEVSRAVSQVLLIGTGATARSAVIAIGRLFPEASIQVLGRSVEKASAICSFGMLNQVHVVPENLRSEVDFDLVFSAIPTSGFQSFQKILEKIQTLGILFDAAYNPWPSKAADYWNSRGYPSISGIHMLIWQAIAQVRLFYWGDVLRPLPNEEAVAEAMLEAASRALN
jgi:shikimate dehydrogenase